MLRKEFIIPLLIALVIIIALSFLYQPWQDERVGVVIPYGLSINQIADKLHQQGIILHPWEFTILAKILNKDKNVKAGFYRLRKRTPALFLLGTLIRGSREYMALTIPEGFQSRDIGQLLARNEIMKVEEFQALVTDTVLIREFDIKANSLEGYLFPDTYYLDPRIDKREIIKMMVRNFFKNIKELKLDDSLQIFLIMASIVEKEARLDEERPIIASIFWNRLRMNRPIESCATVLYAIGQTKPKLTEADLKINSPYNTYRILGLPPGPICSPGLKSITAARYPEVTDYLYFVARGDGSHIFSKTFQQHLEAKLAVNKYGKR